MLPFYDYAMADAYQDDLMVNLTHRGIEAIVHENGNEELYSEYVSVKQ